MIKPGDRVMLVWGCCKVQRQAVGIKGTVLRLSPGWGFCPLCGYETLGEIADVAAENGYNMCALSSWLVKLDPPEPGVAIESGAAGTTRG